MKKYIRLAFKEIWNNRKFALFFTFNLALGLSGFVTLDAFKNGLQQTLAQRSKGILAADIGVGARRPITDDERQTVENILHGYRQKTETFETYSMVSYNGNSRLVEIKAVGEGYPFYGELELASGGVKSREIGIELKKEPIIWVYPELLMQLRAQVGDSLKIGAVQFRVADEVVRDSSGVGGGFSFAQPVYMSLEYFEQTQLFRTGSTGYFSILYELHPQQNAEALAKELNKALTDPAVRVFTYRDASEQVGRMLSTLTDYLGLAAIVALFLTGLGTAFLYRSYLAKRYKDVAILKALGFTNTQIELIFLSQIFVLGLAATIPLLIIAYSLFPLMSELAVKLLQVDVSLTIQAETIFVALFASTACALLICYPLLDALRGIKAKNLFQGSEFQKAQFNLWSFLRYTPAAMAFYSLSVWVAKSWVVSGYFSGAFLGSFVVLFTVGAGLLKLLDNPSPKLPLSWRFTIRNLTRQKFSTISLFLAVALGVLLMNLIPQVQTALQNEIQSPKGFKVPNLFLFDIQEDQLAEIEELVKNEGYQLTNVSPMIRARMSKVNGESFTKAEREERFTREDQNENRFRNRGFNLTYRDQLSDSESLVAGRPFDFSSEEPQISLEERFAERLGLKIGDELTFDISGIEISGRVVNLRKVRWTSFQPNFFIQFNSGILESAPKTFLASLVELTQEQKVQIQNKIVDKAPNVSMIDVSKLIERLAEMIAQMSIALRSMAFLSVIVGFVILFSVANHQAHERRREINLLKVVGSELSQVRNFFLLEFSLITAAAALLGVLLSFAVSAAISIYVFKSSADFDFVTATTTLLIVIALSLVVTYTAIRRVLQSKPRELLQQIN